MIAHEIAAMSNNADDACNRAEQLTDDITQDWTDDGSTTYVFSDGSRLIVSGGQVNAQGAQS